MMQRRQVLRWGMGLLGAAAVGNFLSKEAHSASLTVSDKLIWRERALIGFGTTLWIKAAHKNADQLEQALASAVQVIRSIERQMSLFDPESDLSRLNRFGTLKKPDADLLAVLKIAENIARQSQGAFDASMQPLWEIWSKAASQKSQPTSLEIQRARKRVNWRAVQVTPDAINLHMAGMGVSLNGIAQGYAADRVRATLQAHGVHHAMIDAGETALLGNAPNDKPWSLSIESSASLKNLGAENSLQSSSSPQSEGTPIVISDGRAMATSSDAHTTFSQDHRYHHILNPHTGFSPAQWSSVTVIASSCVVADALTKVFFMTPQDRVIAKARQWGVDVVMQDKAGKWLASSGAPLRVATG